MEWDELLDRSRQAVAKRTDAVRGWLGHDFAGNALGQTPVTRGNFFFAPDSVDSILNLLKQRFPGQAEQIVQQAEKIRRHQFDLLGYSDLNYGSPDGWNIDWHLDAVHAKRAPKKSFHRIRYLDYEQCGDSRVIWELSRHQHLVTLAKAFRLTGDRRYVDEFLRQKRHWEAENPYPIGINWASSLEVAFRSLSLLWSYYLLQSSPGVPDLRGEWLRSLAVHGRHIERYLSTYFSPNTHLLGEGVGLFFLGVLCPELAAATRWKALGWEIILRESERQILSDGFHFERSTYYHVYALDFFQHAAVLAALNNIPLPKSLEERIEKMLYALSLLGRGAPPPRFGDDDGGRLFDPRRNRSEHLLDPLATGAILFHRGDFKAVAAGLREETLWLLGEEGVRQWDQLEATPVLLDSAALAEAGYYLLTSAESQLVIDAGPLGSGSGGHGHADSLSICLRAHGHSLLIDPGTSQYTGPAGTRDLFRATAMHNTLCLDGVSQAEPLSPFSWRTLAESKVEQWVQGHSFDLLIASHDGYKRLPQPVTHRRWVVSVKNGLYLVRDVVEGSGTHRIDIAWHLGAEVEFVAENVFQVKMKDRNRGIALLPAQLPGWTQSLETGTWSPVYGQNAPAKVLNVRIETALPAEFATLLITFETPHQRDSLKRIDADDVSRYEYAAGGSRYSFVFNDGAGVWQSGSLSSDAKFICHKTGPGSSCDHLILCAGSYAAIDGGPDLRTRRRVEWSELVINQAGRTIFSSDTSAILEHAPELADTAALLGEV